MLIVMLGDYEFYGKPMNIVKKDGFLDNKN